MSDDFQYDKSIEMVALNEFMEQQQQKINQLQQEIVLLNTKNTMLEKELAEVKDINTRYKEQITIMTKVDRRSLSSSLSNNRGLRNGISN
jgi:ppGpp synthetase/RelA/SpoT-type nucleotidyltranferase